MHIGRNSHADNHIKLMLLSSHLYLYKALYDCLSIIVINIVEWQGGGVSSKNHLDPHPRIESSHGTKGPRKREEVGGVKGSRRGLSDCFIYHIIKKFTKSGCPFLFLLAPLWLRALPTVQKDWHLFMLQDFNGFMPKIRLLVNSCSCPPLFTLDTLLVFLDTFMKHPTREEFLIGLPKALVYYMWHFKGVTKAISARKWPYLFIKLIEKYLKNGRDFMFLPTTSRHDTLGDLA